MNSTDQLQKSYMLKKKLTSELNNLPL